MNAWMNSLSISWNPRVFRVAHTCSDVLMLTVQGFACRKSVFPQSLCARSQVNVYTSIGFCSSQRRLKKTKSIFFTHVKIHNIFLRPCRQWPSDPSSDPLRLKVKRRRRDHPPTPPQFNVERAYYVCARRGGGICGDRNIELGGAGGGTHKQHRAYVCARRDIYA